jgi:type III restriction enzyme
MFLKTYQQRALDTLQRYFRRCAETDDADTSFYQVTREEFGAGIPYHPVRELPGLPYVCIRIPTGGGKTLVACHAVGLAAKELVRADRGLVLWLVPSNAIRDQTLKALRDRHHPYRLALESAFGSVMVLDAAEALYISRSTLDTETTLIVSTLQAFRVEDTDGRKVYEASGALMGHFAGLPEEAAQKLERQEDGSIVPSLANVLRLRRPIVVVDEAHNARTDLSFETLARFSPSCIIEFTATPDTQDAIAPSNVLHSVSALALQAEDMIKMPIRLETRPNWQELVADAVAMLSQLEAAARAERQETGEYLRPIMLLQAQPHRKDQPTLTVTVVKECLLNDHRIPAEQIAIATGSEWELDDVDLSSPICPIRYVITVQALREGWDCPFAYVLCSVAEMKSSTAVEQILGRVMRLPQAQRKARGELNLAYAFSASSSFGEAARALQDALVENGFERQQASDLIVQATPPVTDLPLFQAQVVAVALHETPNLTYLPASLAPKVIFDRQASTLTFTGVMSNDERKALLQCVSTVEGQSAVERAFRQSQGYVVTPTSSPAERGEVFAVPVLAIQQGNLFEQFEETHFRDVPWSLAGADVSLSELEFPSQRQGGQRGEILMSENGRVVTHFISDVQQQMILIASQQWNVGQLINWLERNILHVDIEPDDMARFLQRMVRCLTDERGLTLDYLIHNKYRLRQAAEDKIERHRQSVYMTSYKNLFLPGCPTPLVVRDDLRFVFDPHRLPAYQQLYRGRYDFPKHYYRPVGDMNNEEAECAQFIDALPQVKFWVRNPVKSDNAFWLQTNTDRFYPDFVCQLQDGRYLAIEYKSERDWSNDDSREKRDLGQWWEAHSEGKCLFVMPKGKDLAAIRAKIEQY